MNFKTTWDKLREYLVESHKQELCSKHNGDSKRPGADPEQCSYCRLIDEHEEWTHTAKEVPIGKQIECRGRNGWFMLGGARVNTVGGICDKKLMTVEFVSKQFPRNVGPIFFQGEPAAIEQLLLHLLLEVGRKQCV